MRREIFRMQTDEALRLLSDAPLVHVASTTARGKPVLRALNAVIVGTNVVFHGSPVGEKAECMGRQAVVGAEEVVAQVPSWFFGPDSACPASTLYRSVQAHGRLEPVEDVAEKARLLQALMARFQPEGRHAPLDARDPLYREGLENLLVVRMAIDRIDGKAKLGQNLPPERLAALLDGLRRRGGPGDGRAVELVIAANPGAARPA